MGKLKLPRLIGNGMILQQKKKVRIWGEDEPGRKVSVSFLGTEYTTETDESGAWEVWLNETEAGDSYQMFVKDSAGEEWVISDVAVGDVWFCTGQSNMELPITRVMDRYPEEISKCTNANIRTFKIIERREFHGPLSSSFSGP